MKNYERGKMKVVWIEDDPRTIYSRMFESKKDALVFAKDKEDFLLFELFQQDNMEEFCWKLLPYGRHKVYTGILNVMSNPKNGIRKIASAPRAIMKGGI